jgi:hypothetical protein
MSKRIRTYIGVMLASKAAICLAQGVRLSVWSNAEEFIEAGLGLQL